MRVLVVNKFWYVRGGLERVMFDEIALLEAAGHSVGHFSTEHPENVPSPWSSYFVPYIELGADDHLSTSQKLAAAMRMFENREAARRFEALVAGFDPDIVHVHGIHRQISPSILSVCRARGVPAVQTVHDYHHVCPADVLLRSGRTPCEPRLCRLYWYGPAVSHRCVKGSTAKSALSAAETSFQRLRRAYERGLDAFIAPSAFMATKMKTGGWTLPVRVIPNAVEARPADSGSPREDFFVYAGRLSPEKGVSVLVDAAKSAGVALKIAGEGPELETLGISAGDVEFLGRLSTDEVGQLLQRCRAAVVPSTALENAPMAVLEPMAAGTPVIASAIGGIPELIRDGQEGLLVPPGDADALSGALSRLARDEGLASQLGDRGRERVREAYSPEQHIEALELLYSEVREKGPAA